MFSLLFTILAIAGVFVLIFLILLGSIIGLIIGIGLMIIAVGFANSIIAELVWGFSVDWSIKSWLLHGTLFFVVLLLINVVIVIAPQIAFPGIATTIVTFIAGCFLDGIAGKAIAEMFTGMEEETSET